MSKPSTIDSGAMRQSIRPRALAEKPLRRWLTHPGVLAIIVLALVVLPLVFPNKFILSVAVTTFITTIAAASLHLIVRTGHVSLGHAAFMGIGAYVSAIATMQLNLAFPIALALGFLVPAAIALVIGPVVLRLTGKYFVLVTFFVWRNCANGVRELVERDGRIEWHFWCAFSESSIRATYSVLLPRACLCGCDNRVHRAASYFGDWSHH
jgi:ABC-type branched-subunit amino acid transport system permease subunit